MLYFNVETFVVRKILYILKSSGIMQHFKSRVTVQLPENVITTYNVDIRDIIFNRITHFADLWIRKQTNYYKFIPHFV